MPCADGFDGVRYAFHFGSDITLEGPFMPAALRRPELPQKNGRKARAAPGDRLDDVRRFED